MSLRDTVLAASRQADSEHPDRLRININIECFRHSTATIEILKAKGIDAAYVGKTRGEGQYTPTRGFPRQIGAWTITGVSHDAIWVEGKQFDLIAGGNDSAESIGTPGTAIANEIPAEFHRPNNPPVPYPLTVEEPAPSPSRILPKGEAFAKLQALNAFYQAPEGLQRPGGLVKFDSEGRSVADMEAIAQWFYQMVIEGVSLENVFSQIRASGEWHDKHPGQ